MKTLPQVIHNSTSPSDVQLPACVDRRAFLASSTMMAVGALLATACGDGQIGVGVTAPDNVSGAVKISDHPALANVGGIVRVDIPRRDDPSKTTPVAILKASATQFRAFSMVCPHQGTVIGIVSGGFLCPNHEARYSSTGAVLSPPSDGGSTSALKEFAVVADLTAGTLSISN